ncbi:putative cysteine desulfurase [Phycisphaerae bacterium RAS2]|nr:putative cysteine desulfurase [Phycisphaerae bacterium RAS2]
MDRLYADNAATSFPKPPEVARAIQAYAGQLGASAGRGAYREALETGEILAETRRRLARLIHATAPEQVIFTFNCSGALNLAIKGLLNAGDHVVATRMEHNSVLRPLHALADAGTVNVDYVRADATTGLVDPADVLAAVTPRTRLVCVVHASNVTGAMNDVAAIGPALRKKNVPFLVDAAQTAGHVPIDVQRDGIDLLALPGHKGLLGPLGTGALYIRPGLESHIRPIIEGGTGSVSELPRQPEHLPDKYEAGSHNAIGIAGLGAALAWIEQRTVAALHQHGAELSARFLEQVRDTRGLSIFGPRDPARRVPVFSLRVDGMDPAEVAAVLETEFGILARSGLHCAPFAHETIGTHRYGGTTRLSLGPFNTPADVDRITAALREIAVAAAPV